MAEDAFTQEEAINLARRFQQQQDDIKATSRETPYPMRQDDLPLYLISGHGTESSECSGKTVPPDTYLLTFTEYDTSTNLALMQSLLREFQGASTPSSTLDRHQLRQLTLLEFGKSAAYTPDTPEVTIRRYFPGELMPNLYYEPTLYKFFPDLQVALPEREHALSRLSPEQRIAFKNQPLVYAGPSGVYNYDVYSESVPTLQYYDFVLLNAAEITPANGLQLFSRSAYPTAADVLQVLPAGKAEFDAHFSTCVHNVMKRLGPGIYLYPLCREEMTWGVSKSAKASKRARSEERQRQPAAARFAKSSKKGGRKRSRSIQGRRRFKR
jgi:hypothetical protein